MNSQSQAMTGIHRLQRVACMIGLLLSAISARADDWPQWRGPNRDGVWHETGILETFPAGGLKVRWRAPVGPGYSSPVVAEGRVFVTDCELGPKEKRQAKERVHCFDEASGQLLWAYSYEVKYPDYAWPPDADPGQGPAPTPIVKDGKVYTVGGMGHLFCFDTLEGKVLWTKDRLNGDFCIRGSPLIEGDLLIVPKGYGVSKGTGIVAFNKDSGKEIWTALEDGGYNSSPLVIAAGGKRQLIVPSMRWVTSVDPATGKIYWQEKFACGIPTPIVSQDRLLVNGLMLKLDPDKPAVSVLWPARKPDAQLSDTTTAIFRGDLILSHKQTNLLVCLEANTGKELWETDKVPSSMHALTLCGDGVFVFTDTGELIRADLTAQGYKEVSRTALIKPTTKDGTLVTYAAPAYANRQVFARNDEELICASLAAEP